MSADAVNDEAELLRQVLSGLRAGGAPAAERPLETERAPDLSPVPELAHTLPAVTVLAVEAPSAPPRWKAGASRTPTRRFEKRLIITQPPAPPPLEDAPRLTWPGRAAVAPAPALAEAPAVVEPPPSPSAPPAVPTAATATASTSAPAEAVRSVGAWLPTPAAPSSAVVISPGSALPAPAGSHALPPLALPAGLRYRPFRLDSLVSVLTQPWVVAALAFAVIAVRRWMQMGAYPPGLDPGNWFALGKGIFGESGKSTSAAFPPLVPASMHLASLVLDEMFIAKFTGIASVLFVVVAVYAVSRQSMGLLAALSAALIVALSAYVNEVAAFGGYPQNFATGLLVFAALFVSRYLRDGRRRDQVWATVAVTLIPLTHHAYFPVAGLVLGLIWMFWLTERPRRRVLVTRTLGLLPAAVLAVLGFLPTFLLLAHAHYEPPLNLARLTLTALIAYNAVEAPWLWIWTFTSGIAFLVFSMRRRADPTWKVGAACALAGLSLYIWSREPRVFPPLVIGSSIGLGMLAEDMLSPARSVLWRLPAAVTLIALVGSLWVRTDARAAELYRFYGFTDESMVNAARWVDEHHADGRVVVRQGREGAPLGWWFEGLTQAYIIVGADERLLGFRGEREHAHLAQQLFDPNISPLDLMTLARENNVRYLVIRETDWPIAETWVERISSLARVTYDDDEFVILDVSPPP